MCEQPLSWSVPCCVQHSSKQCSLRNPTISDRDNPRSLLMIASLAIKPGLGSRRRHVLAFASIDRDGGGRIYAPRAQVLMAYGRNRWAEEEFFESIRGRFTMHDFDAAQLDDTFQTMDVRIFRLCKMPADFCRPVGTGG